MNAINAKQCMGLDGFEVCCVRNMLDLGNP